MAKLSILTILLVVFIISSDIVQVKCDLNCCFDNPIGPCNDGDCNQRCFQSNCGKGGKCKTISSKLYCHCFC
nr:Defensin-like family protein, putative [Ipomoea batatas]